MIGVEEAILVTSWKGEESAADFVERNRTFAFKLSYAILGNMTLAEDATQDAVVRTIRSWETRRDTQATVAWFRRIVINCSIRHCAKKQIESDSSASKGLEFDEILAVRMTLARLSPEHRVLLALAEYEQLSYREIADAMDIPEGTVASRLHTAKQAFRKIWEEK